MHLSASFSVLLLLFCIIPNCITFVVDSSDSAEDDHGEIVVINLDELSESMELIAPSPSPPPGTSPSPLSTTVLPPPPLTSSPTPNDISEFPADEIANNTRCSQTHLSFTKETLLHVWQIKGLIGYISYIKRFEQPFEVKTDHVSFKSDNVDGKWIFKLHKVRHHSPFSVHSSSSPSATTASASSTGYSNTDIGDVRLVVTYSYEAKQPRNIDFILRPTILHGSKEITLPPKKSTSPTIIQQKYYNTRGYQLNSNFFEYVYTFTWTNLIHPLNNIKSSLIGTKYQFESDQEASVKQPDINQPQKQQPSYYIHSSDVVDEGSEELFEEITKTDFSGHFGDITLKFVISAFFPEEPVSFTSSRCNASVLDLVNHNLLEKLVMPTSKHSTGSGYLTKENIKHQRFAGHGIPPYLRYTFSMLHDDRFADVLLVVGEVEIPSHRIILATSSPVFSAILENTTVGHSVLEGKSLPNCQKHLPRIKIEPEDIGVDVVQELLRYIYTGTVDNFKMKEGSMTPQLMIVAEKYGLPELKRHCESILLQGLNVDNAIEMYLLGARVRSDKIMRKSLILMKLNKSRVASQTETFRELSMRHPTLMYDLFLSD